MAHVTKKLHKWRTSVNISLSIVRMALYEWNPKCGDLSRVRKGELMQAYVEADSVDPPRAEVSERRTPQELLLSFFGALVLDHDRALVNARVFIDVLGYLDVSEPAVRATLNRMVRTGLLDRSQTGRIAAFGMSSGMEELLRQGRERVVSSHPFTPADDNWTLLSYSVPETHRDLRRHLRAQLMWAGFGRLRDGLWIAPGVVDVADILARTEAPDARAFAFAGTPLAGIAPNEFVHTAWDLVHIEQQHRRFVECWRNPANDPPNPVAAFTALGADWVRLLRSDPGLPARYLPDPWPAEQSAAVHDDAVKRLAGPAEDMLDHMILSYSRRR